MTTDSEFQLVIDVSNELPAHLGGHENHTHVDEGALDYMIKKFGIKSMLDIGCGPGGMVDLALKKGLDVFGVDGDHTVERPESTKGRIIIHDYATGPYVPVVRQLIDREYFDLGWCVEFVEHIDKELMPNFLATFKKCKYIVMTHAVPGQPGHHHVNCMPAEYWFGVMEAIRFALLLEPMHEIRAASTMTPGDYIKTTGFVFKNLDVA